MLGSGTSDRHFYDSFERHAACVVKAARLLSSALEHSGDVTDLSKEISKLEQAGDQITHDTIARLHKTWITPLDRAHIQGLISALDDVLDFIEAVGERLLLFQIEAVPNDARRISQNLVDACLAVEQAAKLLCNLKQPERILSLCVEINRIENEGDKLYRCALAELYRAPSLRSAPPAGSVPPPHDPLDIMTWRDIYDNLESATDRCEDVANIFEGVVLEYG